MTDADDDWANTVCGAVVTGIHNTLTLFSRQYFDLRVDQVQLTAFARQSLTGTWSSATGSLSGKGMFNKYVNRLQYKYRAAVPTGECSQDEFTSLSPSSEQVW